MCTWACIVVHINLAECMHAWLQFACMCKIPWKDAIFLSMGDVDDDDDDDDDYDENDAADNDDSDNHDNHGLVMTIP